MISPTVVIPPTVAQTAKKSTLTIDSSETWADLVDEDERQKRLVSDVSKANSISSGSASLKPTPVQTIPLHDVNMSSTQQVQRTKVQDANWTPVGKKNKASKKH